jgi:hypothetical protein
MCNVSKQTKGVVLACFSPPVMVASFLVESAMAAYTVYRYKLSTNGRLILALLLCLAFFQGAEYFVCTRSTIAVDASRFGFASITFLPVLGLYLMSQLTRPIRKKVVAFMFTVAGLLAAFFLFSPSAFDNYQCTGNYVIFQIGNNQTLLYSAYYFGLVALSLWKGARFLSSKAKTSTKRPVEWLVMGYLIFVVPVAVLVVLHPDTHKAVPSIMCGFAVGMAIILAAWVAPLTLKRR